MKTWEKTDHKPRGEASKETMLMTFSDHRLSSLKNCDKINFCCLSNSIYGALLKQLGNNIENKNTAVIQFNFC